MPAWMTPLLCVLVSMPGPRVAFEDADGETARGNRTRGGQAGDASADDRHVNGGHTGLAGQAGRAGRGGPCAFRARSRPVPDRRVVEVREHQVVQHRHVGVDRMRERRERAR